MRRNLLPSLLVPAILAGAPTLGAQGADRLTTGTDLIRMHKGGLKEETILDFLKTFHARVSISGQEMADLNAAGFSEGFLQKLFEYVKAQPPEPPAAPRQAEAAPPPAAPAPDRVYDPPLAQDYPVDTTTFVVGYPYDTWVFPLWFYAGPWGYGGYRYGYRGYYGHGWGHGWGRGPGGHFGGGARFGGGFHR
jgi:uncharacterized membrane protein YgcG